MGHQYAAIAFTEEVKRVQEEQSSRAGYAGMEQGKNFYHLLSEREASFIEARDSFYMASVSETDWPYVQHRGGPVGFMRVLDEKTIGFADFSGNRQYISTGNFRKNDRVAIIFMDYANRTRMKLLGRVSLISEDDAETLARLEVLDYRASVERGLLIHVDAFDWNCPQHITPRYTDAQFQEILEPLESENRELKSELNLSNKGLKSEKQSSILGQGPLELVVTGIRQLTPRVRAFEFRSPEGLDLPVVTAGSHLTVPLQLESGEVAHRSYSICSNPARRDIFEIAVLNETQGTGGSKAVHEQYQLGVTLRCELPVNHFELHGDERPAVLIAGGIGITPIKAMAQTLEARKAILTMHYAGRSEKEMVFRDRLQREFGSRLQTYSSIDNERMDIAKILTSATADTVFYVCGPNRLLDDVQAAAKAIGIAKGRVRFERFSVSISGNSSPLSVTLKRSNRQLKVSAEQTILDALLDAGVTVPHSCKAGHCKSCAVKVLEGEPEHLDSSLSETEKSEFKLMCPCVSRAVSPNLVIDL